jgi:serine/threonine-protein kinase
MIRNLTLALSILATLPAAAQPSGASAQAEVLFRQGKELMGAGKTAEACAAFDASQKLEPTISTRMNQANCREKNGQLATAWGLFLDAERQTRSASDGATKQLHQVALDRAGKVEARLSSLRFAVPADHRIAGLEIVRDSDPVDPATWNTKLPVDGGTYTITARAPGVAAWTTTVVVAAERDAKSIEIPKLEPGKRPEPVRPAPDPVPVRHVEPVAPGDPLARPAPITEPPMTQPPPRTGLTGGRKLAIGVAAFGAVGLVAGGVLGVSAQGKQQDAQELCPDPKMPCANADRATALTTAGHSRALQANVALAIGGVALIGAAVMWVKSKPDETARYAIVPQVAPDQAGVAVTGRF